MTLRDCRRAAPPPGSTPSSIAALVAFKASSYRSFLSLSSVSVAAPTLIRAIPPASRATRSSPFSRSKEESELATSFLICSIRALTSAWFSPVEIMVVLSFPTTTLSARPNMSVVTDSKVIPKSSATKLPPQRMAISSKYRFRRSPNPGALIATTSRTPRILLTTIVESASPVISSQIIRSGSLDLTTCSNNGTISETAEIFRSVTRIRGF
mmetsp:Transcript_12295/g.20995  ORF Transcript_12295/g.20995 Transcript_12295/m.20995 type:complete len:211 (+) Transcript_12295:440-1072(+)